MRGDSSMKIKYGISITCAKAEFEQILKRYGITENDVREGLLQELNGQLGRAGLMCNDIAEPFVEFDTEEETLDIEWYNKNNIGLC